MPPALTRIGVDERRARIAVRHCLAPESRAADPVEAARAVVALHSTDAATVFLSTRARSHDFAVGDLERALYEERSLLRMLGMRRTLWVVPRDLVSVVDAACTRTIAARERRRLEGFVRDSGVAQDPAGWIDEMTTVALRTLEARGEGSTSELSRDEPALATKLRLGVGTRWEAEVSTASRVLPLLAAQGAVARARPRGSWINGQYRWVPARDWLGAVEPADPAEARAELLRRWLFAFGPATETDLRWWAGWTAGEARAALASVPHAVVDLDGAEGLVLADDVAPVDPPGPWVALLPTLDPTTMGWKERDWYLGAHASVLFDRNGNAGPTVWCDGRIVGGWSQRKDGEIVYELLEDVGRGTVRAIDSEAERLAEWLGDVRFSPGFLPPFQRRLAS